MTFALILSVLTITGDRFDAVIDYNLTKTDCLQLQWEWSATLKGQPYANVTCTAN
jgi:hypothetical protein